MEDGAKNSNPCRITTPPFPAIILIETITENKLHLLSIDIFGVNE